MMNRKNLPSKKIILISVFLAMFTVGTILMFIVPISVKATYGLSTVTEDGVRISFNMFEPVGRESQPKKAVIIGHGVMANKEFMKGYAIELSCAGFVAVPFDFRGHGQSGGELDITKLTYDVNAIINFLNTTSITNIDIDNLSYIGYSMGGWPGNTIINTTLNFKCFIGVGTGLGNIRLGNSTDPLNVLMIHARFDEAFDISELKTSLATRIGTSPTNVDVNKMYGSFENGNASMIILDDNTDHLLLVWDQDFIRASRNWVMNTFPSVRAIDENFYVNIRQLILMIQVIGGIGFFFLIIEPLSKLILKSDKREIEFHKIELAETSLGNLVKNTLLYSLSIILPLAGILMMIWIIFLPLSIAGLMIVIFFGQAFAFLILLWRIGKKADLSAKTILHEPFKGGRNNWLKHVLLGAILAVLLYVILYLSIGFNYLGIVPSIEKIFWMALYFAFFLILMLINGIVFQLIFHNKFKEGYKNLIKSALLNFVFLSAYVVFYITLLCVLLRNYFFMIFLIVIIPLFLLASFVSTYSYQKTGNIVVSSIVMAFIHTCISCTLSPYGISFIMGFLGR